MNRLHAGQAAQGGQAVRVDGRRDAVHRALHAEQFRGIERRPGDRCRDLLLLGVDRVICVWPAVAAAAIVAAIAGVSRAAARVVAAPEAPEAPARSSTAAYASAAGCCCNSINTATREGERGSGLGVERDRDGHHASNGNDREHQRKPAPAHRHQAPPMGMSRTSLRHRQVRIGRTHPSNRGGRKKACKGCAFEVRDRVRRRLRTAVAMSEPLPLTQLIHRAQHGDREAADALYAATYADLRRLARSRLRAGSRHTLLDTGSLVHESYIRFAAASHLRLEGRGALHALGRPGDALGDRRLRAASPGGRGVAGARRASRFDVELAGRRRGRRRNPAACTRRWTASPPSIRA